MISFSTSTTEIASAKEPLMTTNTSDQHQQPSQPIHSLMETSDAANTDQKTGDAQAPGGGRFSTYKSPFRKPFRAQKPMQPKVDKSVKCETCNIVLNSQLIYETHCQGTKHLKRLAQINAILPHVTGQNGGDSANNKTKDTNGEDVKPPTIVAVESEAMDVTAVSSASDSSISQPERGGSGEATGVTQSEGPAGTTTGPKQRRQPFKRFKKNQNAAEPKPPKAVYSCELCNATGMHDLAYQAHLVGKNHAKKVKAAGGDPAAAVAAALAAIPNASMSVDAAVASSATETGALPSRALKPALVQYRCDICQVNLTSDIQFELHVKSVKHQKKLEQQSNGGAASGGAGGGETTKPTKPSEPPQEYKCDVCNVKLAGKQQLDAHLAGKKHQKKLNSKANGATTGGAGGSAATEDDEKYAHLNIAWDKYRIVDNQSIPDPNMRGKYEFYCALCNKYMLKKTQLVDHLKCKRHHQKIYEKRQRDAGLPVGNQKPAGAGKPPGKHQFKPKFNGNKKISFVPGASGGSFSSVNYNSQTSNPTSSIATTSTNQSMGLLNYPVNPFYSGQQQQQQQQEMTGFKRKPDNMSANIQKFPRLDNQQQNYGAATSNAAAPPIVGSSYGYGYDFSYAAVNFFNNQQYPNN